MEIDALLRALEATSVATVIRENESLFPWIESLHVLAITMVIGSIAIVDLRLIGLASLERAAARLTSDVLPCTWAAFAGAVITGSLLFSSNALITRITPTSRPSSSACAWLVSTWRSFTSASGARSRVGAQRRRPFRCPLASRGPRRFCCGSAWLLSAAGRVSHCMQLH